MRRLTTPRTAALGRAAVGALVAMRATRSSSSRLDAVVRLVSGRFSPTGVTVGLAAQMAGTSPSFVPRPWYTQSFINGIVTSTGYGIGTAAEALVLRCAHRIGVRVDVTGVDQVAARRMWHGGLAAMATAMWFGSLGRQREQARLVELPDPTARGLAASLAAGAALSGALTLTGRGVLLLWRRGSDVTRPFLPRYFPEVVSGAGVVAGGYLLTHRVLLRAGLERAGQIAIANNRRFPDFVHQPSSPCRSGSPASAESWESLGNQGRMVMADGPDAALIEEVTGAPALQPIRAYAGKVEDRDIEATADAVVAELDRTDAWSRKVLVVYTTTGTGWVQEWALAGVEYLTGGDCALASMQYSYITSGIAFVTDHTSPVVAGRALFNRVYARWSALPPDARPRLFVSGESLGAYGGLAAFTDAEDLLASVDGAVWVGTPSTTAMHRAITDDRDRGSHAVCPMVDGGRHIRFAGTPRDLVEHPSGLPFQEWQAPRVVFAQHPSDPIVWGSAETIWRQPAWLREPRGRDVSPAMRWFPWVTFWQLFVDAPLSITPPGGHGHNYWGELVSYWAAVLGLDPAGDYSHIVAAIAEHRLQRPPMLGARHRP